METPKDIKKKLPTTKKKPPVKPKTATQEVKIVVEHTSPTVNPDMAVEPIREKNKLSLVPTWLSKNQLVRIMQRTPAEYIYERMGAGGKIFKFVPVHYVLKMLNFVFGWNWDFQIISKEVYGLESGNGQIVICGRLTVKDETGQFSVFKEQFGQASVKYLTETKNGQKVKTNNIMNIGNDFKSASSDALKKCASELGIASDVYGVNEYKELKVEVLKDDVAEPLETLFEKIKSMVEKATSAGTLQALNISVTNAQISEEERQTLYDIIEARASEFTGK